MRRNREARMFTYYISLPFKIIWNIVVFCLAVGLTIAWIGFLFGSVLGVVLVLIFAPDLFLLPMVLMGLTKSLEPSEKVYKKIKEEKSISNKPISQEYLIQYSEKTKTELDEWFHPADKNQTDSNLVDKKIYPEQEAVPNKTEKVNDKNKSMQELVVEKDKDADTLIVVRDDEETTFLTQNRKTHEYDNKLSESIRHDYLLEEIDSVDNSAKNIFDSFIVDFKQETICGKDFIKSIENILANMQDKRVEAHLQNDPDGNSLILKYLRHCHDEIENLIVEVNSLKQVLEKIDELADSMKTKIRKLPHDIQYRNEFEQDLLHHLESILINVEEKRIEAHKTVDTSYMNSVLEYINRFYEEVDCLTREAIPIEKTFKKRGEIKSGWRTGTKTFNSRETECTIKPIEWISDEDIKKLASDSFVCAVRVFYTDSRGRHMMSGGTGETSEDFEFLVTLKGWNLKEMSECYMLQSISHFAYECYDDETEDLYSFILTDLFDVDRFYPEFHSFYHQGTAWVQYDDETEEEWKYVPNEDSYAYAYRVRYFNGNHILDVDINEDLAVVRDSEERDTLRFLLKNQWITKEECDEIYSLLACFETLTESECNSPLLKKYKELKQVYLKTKEYGIVLDKNNQE